MKSGGGSTKHQIRVECHTNAHHSWFNRIFSKIRCCRSTQVKLCSEGQRQAMPTLALISFLWIRTALYLMSDVVSIMSCDRSVQNQTHHPLPSSFSFDFVHVFIANSGAGLQRYNLINVHVSKACVHYFFFLTISCQGE